MVLVVDDEPVALAVLQRTLEPHYHVLTASDGEAALAGRQGRAPQYDTATSRPSRADLITASVS